ncbi:MAG: hypothetical protein HC831_30230 [Chloroflexia bacterium]|nr:hypothetical protein [Chloroflexia bacterium]
MLVRIKLFLIILIGLHYLNLNAADKTWEDIFSKKAESYLDRGMADSATHYLRLAGNLCGNSSINKSVYWYEIALIENEFCKPFMAKAAT